VSRDSENPPSPVLPDRLDHLRDWKRPDPPAPRLEREQRSTRSDIPAWVEQVSVQELAQWGCVTEQYARMIKAGSKQPSPIVEKLVRLHLAGRVMPESWAKAGFAFAGRVGSERLCGPQGLSSEPGEVLGIPFRNSHIAALQAEQRRFRADAEYAADLRHAYERLRSAFAQIGGALSDADRLLSRQSSDSANGVAAQSASVDVISSE
jgi:hypothetical protein